MSSITAALGCRILVRAFRVLEAPSVCCFLPPFLSLCSCTAPQPTFPLLFIFFLTSLFTLLYSSPASMFVYLCCLGCRLWSHRSRTPPVTQGLFIFLCFSETSLDVESSTSFRLFARLSTLLSRTQGCKLSACSCLEHFRYFRVFKFLQV